MYVSFDFGSGDNARRTLIVTRYNIYLHYNADYSRDAEEVSPGREHKPIQLLEGSFDTINRVSTTVVHESTGYD